MVRRAGKSPPGGRDDRLATPCQQRPHEQDRPAQPPHQRAVGLVLRDVLALDAERRRADAVDVGADVQQQPAHDVDVGNARHVVQHAELLGEHARRDQRQGRVLVALDVEAAIQTMPAFYDKCGHGLSG